MRHWLTIALACILGSAIPDSADAQLLAFPGAEGVAQHVTGGRGTLANPGDVYIVTTLDDYDSDDDPNTQALGGDRYHPNDAAETPIVGSLRHGILTAPSTGRTIVFAVGGTIDLHDSLRFDGKSNITIAGQTAPGGGITLAKHDLNINNADNVIVQHVRIRPGERTAASHPLPQYAPGPRYNPDALWVERSTNVMIDHVSASWGVDETISTTHESDNVTVQWSMVYQGLFEGGHTEGSGHAYGSLINGHNYTFHHNLYAHTNSRNPRPQISDGNELHLDWVNNVLFNPHDQFGNSSGDAYYMNYVGNYGVKGPETNNGTSFLMSPGNGSSHIYQSGNVVDFNRDGILNGSAATEADVVRPTHTYISEGARLFPALLPDVASQSAQQAYIHVLSRAGVLNYRDPIDHRAIRSVLNHMGDQIDTQADVGGWPTLPSGVALPDSNSDGVPDSWAAANYGDTATPLNSAFALDGYSYLEKYIHSLTPRAYTPTNTVEHTIHTSFGDGADAQINENGGLSATSSGSGSGNSIGIHWDGASGNTNQAMLLRFDLSGIEAGSIDSARLDLTAATNITGTHQFKIYGLEHNAANWDWDESTIEFDNSPGVDFDGNSRTLGIDPRYTANGSPGTQTNTPLLASEDLLTLGTFSIGATSTGQSVGFENLNLAVFLNLAAFFEDEAMAGFATIIIEQISSSTAATFWSKEGNALLGPRLVVDAVLAAVEPGGLMGDYNGNDAIDAADYTVWRDALAAGATSLTNDPTPGVVDESDFTYWRNHFGETMGSGSGQGSVAVPEPTSAVLLLCGAALLAAVRKSSRLGQNN